MKEFDRIPGVCNCQKCNRPPVIVKTKGGPWRVACPYLDCENLSSYGATERQAIKNWNDGKLVKT